MNVHPLSEVQNQTITIQSKTLYNNSYRLTQGDEPAAAWTPCCGPALSRCPPPPGSDSLGPGVASGRESMHDGLEAGQ